MIVAPAVLIRKVQSGHGLSNVQQVIVGWRIRVDIATSYGRVFYCSRRPAYLIMTIYPFLCRLLVP